jgi:hypothetical protein
MKIIHNYCGICVDMGWRKKGDLCPYVNTCRYGVEEEGGYVSTCVDMSVWRGGRGGICVDMYRCVDMGWRKREDMCRYVGMTRSNKGICVNMSICVNIIFTKRLRACTCFQTFVRVNIFSIQNVQSYFAIQNCNNIFPYFAIIFAIQNLQSYFSIFCNHISKLKLQFKLQLQFNMMNIHIQIKIAIHRETCRGRVAGGLCRGVGRRLWGGGGWRACWRQRGRAPVGSAGTGGGYGDRPAAAGTGAGGLCRGGRRLRGQAGGCGDAASVGTGAASL